MESVGCAGVVFASRSGRQRGVVKCQETLWRAKIEHILKKHSEAKIIIMRDNLKVKYYYYFPDIYKSVKEHNIPFGKGISQIL